MLRSSRQGRLSGWIVTNTLSAIVFIFVQLNQFLLNEVWGMGDLMNIKPPKDELDLAAEEFEETYKVFEKAAKRLMAIMDSMNKKRNQELEALSGDSKQVHEFLIQMMDKSGQIGEKCFGIKCVADKEKKFSNPY